MCGEEACSYFREGFERQYKVCNFVLEKEPTGHSSKPVSSSVCVLPLLRKYTQKGSPPRKKDMCEVSLSQFLLHTNAAVEE